jgi:hypothetical protein
VLLKLRHKNDSTLVAVALLKYSTYSTLHYVSCVLLVNVNSLNSVFFLHKELLLLSSHRQQCGREIFKAFMLYLHPIQSSSGIYIDWTFFLEEI